MQLTFRTLDDRNDPTFNQLLAINNQGTIAGYFGQNVNKGYTLIPSAQPVFTDENFNGSAQTQVTGINDHGTTVGFWADANGDNFGFVDVKGEMITALDPKLPQSAPGTPAVEQFLGVNDQNQVAGFYTDAKGANHGFVYDASDNSFTAVKVSGFTNVTASDINNSGVISGFGTFDSKTEGFIDDHGRVTVLTGPKGATSVMALGLNDKHEVVGSFTDASGTHGFLYEEKTHTYVTIDQGGQNNTTINGINDKGQLVGFFLDANQHTDGLLVQVQGHHGS